MSEEMRGGMEEHLGNSAREAEAKLTEMNGGGAMGGNCEDALSTRDLREQRRYAETDQYEQQLRAVLKDEVRYIYRKAPRGPIAYLRDGSRIQDLGNRLVASQMNSADAARRIVAIAIEVKGWQRISFNGSPEFIEAAFRESLKSGLTVVPKDEGQKAVLASILSERGSAGGAACQHSQEQGIAPDEPSPSLTPSPKLPVFGADIQQKLNDRRRELEARARPFTPARPKNA